MIARPAARSTCIACIFIATSTAPSPAPKLNNKNASAAKSATVAKNGNVLHSSAADQMITARQPNREAKAPAIGIAQIDPIPTLSSRNPSAPSPIPSRSLA